MANSIFQNSIRVLGTPIALVGTHLSFGDYTAVNESIGLLYARTFIWRGVGT